MYCYINILLLVVVLFILAKNVKEGYINELNKPPNGIPNVPSDSACLVFKLVGAPVNVMGTITNGCRNSNNNLKQDNTETCPA